MSIKMDKIGIFGGTFNPIHNGHLILAQNALEFCHLSKIIFLPSGCSYLKDQSLIASKSDRINMVRAAIEGNDNFILSTLETEKEGNTYSYETLTDFSNIYPDAHLYFIIGDDTLFSIENWKKPEIIFQLSSIIVAPRDINSLDIIKKQIDYLQDKFKADIILLETENIEISSSNIRELIKSGHSARYYIPEKVREYIYNNNLYL